MILLENINRGLGEYRTTSGAILVDVREANEFATGHIPGAVNAPLSTISKQRFRKRSPCSSNVCAEHAASGRRGY